MVINTVRKGAKLAQHIARRFKELGIEPFARAMPRSGGWGTQVKEDDFRGDVYLSRDLIEKLGFTFHIEAKNQKIWEINKWIDQCWGESAPYKLPMLVMKRDREPRIYALMDLEDLLRVVKGVIDKGE